MPSNTADQQLIIPANTDLNDVPTSISQLILGLATNGLESRLVKRYASAADRTTRNPTPNTGELCYRVDAGVFEYYNGSTWTYAWAQGMISSISRGTVSANITGTEVITDSITFTAVAGRRYRLTHQTIWTSTVANDAAIFRFRYAAGASLTNAGTLFYNITTNTDVAGHQMPLTIMKDITGIAAGQTTIGVGLLRSGTGTITSNPFNESGGTLLMLEDIGT